MLSKLLFIYKVRWNTVISTRPHDKLKDNFNICLVDHYRKRYGGDTKEENDEEIAEEYRMALV